METTLNRDYLDSSVRWTDKLTLTHDGNIIRDFTGEVVGHINIDWSKQKSITVIKMMEVEE